MTDKGMGEKGSILTEIHPAGKLELLRSKG